MRRPRLRPAVLARCAVPVAALLSGVLVWDASSAAFWATTGNEANRFRTGEVTIGDDDAGVARYAVANMKPGQIVYRCIKVTSTSTVPTTVKAYVRNVSSTKGLANHSQVAIEEVDGEGGFAEGCTTFRSSVYVYNRQVTNAGNIFNTYETGGGTWSPPVTGGSQLYRIDFGIHGNAPDSTQGGTVRLDVVWEARSS